MKRTAIIAGSGALPALLAAELPEAERLLAALEGVDVTVPGETPMRFRVERLVPFLDHLVEQGVVRVVFAGAVQRPRLDPEAFDPQTAQMVPRLLTAMQGGDDATLRAVIDIFEDWGLEVVGAETLVPGLVPGPGFLVGSASEADARDAERAAIIVAALGTVDVGQGAVVAGGLCLAVETLPGTDAMLDWVRDTAGAHRRAKGGVLFKAPKPGQDRRVDLPAIGPDTVRRAAAAGLSGIAWEAGGVMLLDRDTALSEAAHHGLFLWSRAT